MLKAHEKVRLSGTVGLRAEPVRLELVGVRDYELSSPIPNL